MLRTEDRVERQGPEFWAFDCMNKFAMLLMRASFHKPKLELKLYLISLSHGKRSLFLNLSTKEFKERVLEISRRSMHPVRKLKLISISLKNLRNSIIHV